MIDKIRDWRYRRASKKLQIEIGKYVLFCVRMGRFDLEKYMLFQGYTQDW